MIALNKIGQGAASCLLSAGAAPTQILALKLSGLTGRQAGCSSSPNNNTNNSNILTRVCNEEGNLIDHSLRQQKAITNTVSKRYLLSSSSSSQATQECARSTSSLPIEDQIKPNNNNNGRTWSSNGQSTSNTVCYSEYETLQVSSPISRVLHIQLNRPGKRNALNRQALQELQSVFRTIHEDTGCRAVVISGEGKDFSSGLDHQDIENILHEISSSQGLTVNRDVARRAKFLRNLLSKYQETFNMVERCAKPVIASVHGACLGAALNLICCADVRFCAQDSFFQLKDVSAGMMADMGVLQRMPKMVANDSWIRELALTARRATSAEAKENGLVSRVYENQQQALNGALEMAASITNNSPVAVQGTKLCLNYSRDHSVHDGLVWALNWNMGMLQSEDLVKAMEGVGRGHDAPEFDDL